jgi:hypothetical protein
MSESLRRIISRGPGARHAVQSLLQSLWLAEVLQPARLLLVAVPVLADLMVLDNRAGAFSDLEPSWGERPVAFSELLVRNLVHKGRVAVQSGSDPSSRAFRQRLQDLASDAGVASRLRQQEREMLPVQGLIGDDYHLAGGLVLSAAGADLAEEGVALDVGQPASQRGIESFVAAYGGFDA